MFFFWGSSATLNESEHEVLLSNKTINQQGNNSVFSIVTYNIGYLSGMTNNLPVEKSKELFAENLQKVILETQKVNPDIIAFQEIDYNATRSYKINQQEEIAKQGYGYRAQAINWDERYVPFPYWPISM